MPVLYIKEHEVEPLYEILMKYHRTPSGEPLQDRIIARDIAERLYYCDTMQLRGRKPKLKIKIE